MKKVALCLLVIVAAVLTACSSTAEPSLVPRTEFTLKATDIAFDNTRLEAQAGQPVRLTLQNEGVLEHDFSIMEMPHTGEVVVDHEVMAGHDMGHMSAEPDIHVAAAAGSRNMIEFVPSEPGEYEFVCTVAGHKEAGMVGTLVVKAP
ncbi:MAG TPA: cupredoxin domain-containing protein [Chloroflexota bacterium]|nr:cupredoxin domain-containing protein [Chloroflexota bacterium]HUM67457.1 cupredoxin domain-containing protein [Chloroflexota bacterium]